MENNGLAYCKNKDGSFYTLDGKILDDGTVLDVVFKNSTESRVEVYLFKEGMFDIRYVDGVGGGFISVESIDTAKIVKRRWDVYFSGRCVKSFTDDKLAGEFRDSKNAYIRDLKEIDRLWGIWKVDTIDDAVCLYRNTLKLVETSFPDFESLDYSEAWINVHDAVFKFNEILSKKMEEKHISESKQRFMESVNYPKQLLEMVLDEKNSEELDNLVRHDYYIGKVSYV